MDQYRTLKAEIAQYKGVVFDLDGTFVDLKVDWIGLKKRLSEIVRLETGAQVEFTPIDQTIAEVRKKFGKEIFRQVLETVSEYELREESYALNEKLLELYESLEGKKIAIYSMNTQKCVDNFVRKYLKIKPDIIIAKDNCIEPKPSAKDLHEILKQWQCLPQEVVYIGNTDNDRISGELANIKTIIISID